MVKLALTSIAFFLCLTYSSYAQRDSTRNANAKDSFTVCIKIAPLSLIDFGGGPVARIGTEKKIWRNISVYAEYGIFVPGIRYKHDELKGHVFRIEPKIYLNKKHVNTGRYISVEYFYKQQNYFQLDTMYTKPATVLRNHFDKNIHCINMRFGELAMHHNRFITEAFCGLGIIFKRVTSSATPAQQNSIDYPGDYGGGIIGWSSKLGRFALPYIIGGFKFGICIT